MATVAVTTTTLSGTVTTTLMLSDGDMQRVMTGYQNHIQAGGTITTFNQWIASMIQPNMNNLVITNETVIPQPPSITISTGTATNIVPAGAAALNFNTKVIDLAPQLSDICPTATGTGSLFDTLFYDNTPVNTAKYTMTNGVLTLPPGSTLCTQQHNSTAGKLPYLAGSTGFYMEFEVALSSNNSDHWPAVWSLPWEHDLRSPQSDIYAGDPAGYERWMELDVDEGGFTTGLLNSVIDWQGVFDSKNGQYWRNYPTDTVPGNVITNSLNTPANVPSGVPTTLDRTVPHRFGASYNAGQVKWYLDDQLVFSATAPAIAAQQHFYMIASNNTHGQNIPYNMFLYRIRAYTP